MEAILGPDQANEPGNTASVDGRPDLEAAPPWEMVAAGRYMPRRIRGSCRGRELG